MVVEHSKAGVDGCWMVDFSGFDIHFGIFHQGKFETFWRYGECRQFGCGKSWDWLDSDDFQTFHF